MTYRSGGYIRIACHRIACHRIACHRIACHRKRYLTAISDSII